MKLAIKKGNKLSKKEIKKIFDIWKIAFEHPRERKETYANDIFFILKNSKKEILSVGRLRPVKIKFLEKIYHIMGIADIVSVKKKKGYEKRIMTAIKKYLKDKKKTGIGFCFRKNSKFYKKCSYKIAKNQVVRFVYRNKKKKTYGDKDINKIDVDVIYFAGKDDFINNFLKNKTKYAKIYIPHW